MAATFSDHALTKMMDLYNNHAHECGSKVTAANPGKTPTDCITYVIHVLAYAFEKDGKKSAADEVKKLGAYGTKLSKYLVDTHGWKCVYINPDVNHPRDKDFEHVLTYKQVSQKMPYYGLPISHSVVNYTPTKSTDPNYVSYAGQGMSPNPTPEDDTQMAELKKVKFAIGISRGGKHTWLFSNGLIYEVHWDKVGADLYGTTDIEQFSWLSGAVVIPPDAYPAAKFETVKQVKGTKSIWDWIKDLF